MSAIERSGTIRNVFEHLRERRIDQIVKEHPAASASGGNDPSLYTGRAARRGRACSFPISRPTVSSVAYGWATDQGWDSGGKDVV
jgi:hypothetical protein